jgi:hypothetical protein
MPGTLKTIGALRTPHPIHRRTLMDTPYSEPIPKELRTLVDTEIKIEGMASFADEPKLQAAVAGANGVVSVGITENAISVRHDPERITKAAICSLITQAGFRVVETESAPPAPPIEGREETPDFAEAKEKKPESK